MLLGGMENSVTCAWRVPPGRRNRQAASRLLPEGRAADLACCSSRVIGPPLEGHPTVRPAGHLPLWEAPGSENSGLWDSLAGWLPGDAGFSEQPDGPRFTSFRAPLAGSSRHPAP